MAPGGRLLNEHGKVDLRGPVRRMLSERYAHYKRAAEILGALSRFGFGTAWEGASGPKAKKGEKGDGRDEGEEAEGAKSTPRRFRLLLESLGPTFIKLGQMLSTRPDLIPEDFAEELGNLRENVPPVDFACVKGTVEKELGKRLEEAFASFSEKPVASASIGQVHRAVLKGGGEAVAVKVQRPGLEELVRTDITVLRDMVKVLRRAFSGIPNFDPEAVVDEFGRMVLREIDYTIEARNVQRFAENLKELKGQVAVPRLYWELSSRRVLTMEFIEGSSLDKVGELERRKVDPKALTDALGKTYIKMIFVDGFFHADPHQGNLFLMKDGRVCLLDFGAIGYLDESTRDQAAAFYMSLVKKDTGRAAAALLDLSGVPDASVDLRNLEWDLRDFLDYTLLRRSGVTMASGMNQRIVSIALKHGIMLSPSFVLLERALAEIEGVCRSLDPGFDVVELTEKNLGMMLEARYMPRPDPMQAVETARSYRELMRTLPRRVDRVLRKLERDELQVRVVSSDLRELRRNIRKVGLLMAVTLIAAALILEVGFATIDLPVLHVSLGVSAILLIWLVSAVLIYRRA